MKSRRRYRGIEILKVIFCAIFALPVVGAYLMLDKDMETKVIGGILCIVGLVSWFLFALH